MSYLYADLKKRVAMEIVSGFSFLIPALGGLTLLVAAWTVSSAPLAALGGIGLLASGAIAASRYLLSSKTIEQRVLEKIKKEEAAKDRAKLDSLFMRLSKDGDSRTEVALHDLRNLRVTLHNCETRDMLIGSSDTINIVEDLFQQTIKSLEQTLSLQNTISQITNKKARKQLIDQRENIIKNVEKSIVEIGKVVCNLQVLVNSDISEQESLRADLAESMNVVNKVHEEMTNWQQGNFSSLQEVVT